MRRALDAYIPPELVQIIGSYNYEMKIIRDIKFERVLFDIIERFLKPPAEICDCSYCKQWFDKCGKYFRFAVMGHITLDEQYNSILELALP